MPQRLPRFYVRQERIEFERKLARILLETGAALPAADAKPANGAGGGNRHG